MEPAVDKINSVLRPAMKNRLGTQENINGARTLAQREWNKTSLSAGQLAYALVIEIAYWVDINIKNVFIPADSIDESVRDMIWNICSKADSTHGKGSKAVAGAAVGLNFGVLGALVGAAFGWAVGQSAANNDLQSVILYAGQAIEYLCDVICQKTQALINNIRSNKKEENNGPKPIEAKKESNGYPKFVDVIGLEEAKFAVEERVIKPSKNPEIYRKYGKKVGGGILLYGLPGTGKTMFAQAVANELNGKFFSVKASDLKSKFFGETEEKIKNLFTEARNEKIAVIFIDEFEAIGMDRNKSVGASSDPTTTTVVPELLAQMQGFEQESENILLVIAATNRPWDIDSALTRPGRFDYKVYVDLPNKECRMSMLKNYLKKILILDYPLNVLADKTEGYNGADIKNVCDSLVQIVIDKEIEGITNYHIDLNDVENVLTKIKSSVSQQDVYLMELFKKQK